MATGNLGIGSVSTYEVLTLKDGMTIGELVDALKILPREGTIQINEMAQRVSSQFVRFPIEVARGQLAGKEL